VRRGFEDRAIEQPGKVLLIKTHAIGDVLLTTPAIRAISNGLPDSEITFLTGEWSSQAIETNPHIDRLIVVPDEVLFNRKMLEVARLLNDLRKRHFDMALIFQPSVLVHFLPMLSGIRRRIGFSEKSHELGLSVCVPWYPRSGRYIADVYMDLARELGLEPEPLDLEFHSYPADKNRIEKLLEGFDIRPGEPVVGIFAGGGENPRDRVPHKLWRVEQFGQVGNYLQSKYRARLLVLGTNRETSVNRELMRLMRGKALDMTGELNFSELGALLDKLHLVITNDSAPLHLAIARKVPTISIFGPTDPASLIPNDPRHLYVSSSLECSPCYTNEAFPGCDNPLCMKSISADSVTDLVDRQMERIRSRLLEEEENDE
jgi:lipopolysaccharide heptosyltransferase II